MIQILLRRQVFQATSEMFSLTTVQTDIEYLHSIPVIGRWLTTDLSLSLPVGGVSVSSESDQQQVTSTAMMGKHVKMLPAFTFCGS